MPGEKLGLGPVVRLGWAGLSPGTRTSAPKDAPGVCRVGSCTGSHAGSCTGDLPGRHGSYTESRTGGRTGGHTGGRTGGGARSSTERPCTSPGGAPGAAGSRREPHGACAAWGGAAGKRSRGRIRSHPSNPAITRQPDGGVAVCLRVSLPLPALCGCRSSGCGREPGQNQPRGDWGILPPNSEGIAARRVRGEVGAPWPPRAEMQPQPYAKTVAETTSEQTPCGLAALRVWSLGVQTGPHVLLPRDAQVPYIVPATDLLSTEGSGQGKPPSMWLPSPALAPCLS